MDNQVCVASGWVGSQLGPWPRRGPSWDQYQKRTMLLSKLTLSVLSSLLPLPHYQVSLTFVQQDSLGVPGRDCVLQGRVDSEPC